METVLELASGARLDGASVTARAIYEFPALSPGGSLSTLQMAEVEENRLFRYGDGWMRNC